MLYPPTVMMELIRLHGRQLEAEAAGRRATKNAPNNARRIRRTVGRRLVTLGLRIDEGAASTLCLPPEPTEA